MEVLRYGAHNHYLLGQNGLSLTYCLSFALQFPHISVLTLFIAKVFGEEHIAIGFFSVQSGRIENWVMVIDIIPTRGKNPLTQ